MPAPRNPRNLVRNAYVGPNSLARSTTAAAPPPAFLRHSRTATPAPAWQWALLIALTLLLIMQILLADRARLATDARWRPALINLCEILRCQLPPWHQPDAFTMLTRSVRPAASQPGVLEVRANFRNDARWSQQWPELQLTLSDADGRIIGSRVFSPRDYQDPAHVAADLLDPGQTAQVFFRIRQPAIGAEAFSFEFH